MVQNLFRWCLVWSLIFAVNFTIPVAAEDDLRLSDFEDKEIPLLLKWKGEKPEKRKSSRGGWYQWVREDQAKTLKTAEMNENPDEKDVHTIVFKRSVERFKPNIDPLKSLLRTQPEHSNNKRWLPGFGSKKKHDSKKISSPQPQMGTTQRMKCSMDHVLTSGGKFRHDQEYNFVGVGDFNQTRSFYTVTHFDPDDVLRFKDDPTIDIRRLKERAHNFGAHLDRFHKPTGDDLRATEVSWEAEKEISVSFKPGHFHDAQSDVQSSGDEEHEQSDRDALQPTNYLVQAPRKTVGDFKSTRVASVPPRFWIHHSTETIFDRLAEPFTELRSDPFKNKNKFQFSSNPWVPYPAHPTTERQQSKQEKFRMDPRGVIDSRQVSSNGFEMEPTPTYESKEPEVLPNLTQNADETAPAANFHNPDAIEQVSYLRNNGEAPMKVLIKSRSPFGDNGRYKSRYRNFNSGVQISNHALIIPGFKKEEGSSTETLDDDDPSNVNQKDDVPYEHYIQAFRSNKNTSKYSDSYGYKNSTVNPYIPQNVIPFPGGGVNISILMPTNNPAFVTQITPDQRPVTVDKYKKRKERKKSMKTSETAKYDAALKGKKTQRIVSKSKFGKGSPLFDRLSTSIKPFGIVEKISLPEPGLLNELRRIHYGALGNIETTTGFAESNFLVMGDFNLLPNSGWTNTHPHHHEKHLGSTSRPVHDYDDEENENKRLLYDEPEQSKNVEDNQRYSPGMYFFSHPTPRHFFWQKYTTEGLEGHITKNSFQQFDITKQNPRMFENVSKAESLDKLNGSDKADVRMPWNVASYPPDFLGRDSPTRRAQIDRWGTYTFPVRIPGANKFLQESQTPQDVPPELKGEELSKTRNSMGEISASRLVSNIKGQQPTATEKGRKKDAWDALDDVLNNNYVEREDGPIKWQVQNRKREADYNELDTNDNNEEFYRLSHYRSPANMLVHVLRGGKGYKGAKFDDYEEVTEGGKNSTDVKPANSTSAAKNHTKTHLL